MYHQKPLIGVKGRIQTSNYGTEKGAISAWILNANNKIGLSCMGAS